MKATPIAMLCAALLTTGCATHPTNPQDPLEPMNRSIYTFNDKVDRAIAKPVAQAYRTVTPQPVRTGVSNFFDNLLDAYSFANDILSAQPVKAMNDLMRVAVNSTLGVFGLVDFATPMGLKSNKTNLGDTLARWGWKDSNYLVLPLLGPSTVRDGLGTVTTMYVGPERRILFKHPATANAIDGVHLVNSRERLLDVSDTVDEAALDPYSYTRDAYLQLRAAQLGNSQASAPASQTPGGDDLGIDQLVAPDAAPSSAPVSAKADASAAH